MRSSIISSAAAKPVSAAILLLGGMAFAAPAAAEDSPFEGIYVGINGGVTWGDSTSAVTLTPTASAPSVNPLIAPGDITAINGGTAKFDSRHRTGFTGGLEGGYNWVGVHGLLIGFETDIDIFDIKGERTDVVASSVTPTTSYTLHQKVQTDWLWTLRPRIGYATGNFAAFLSGGLAFTNVKYHADFTDSSTAANDVLADHNWTHTGWTVGAGAAYAFGAISVKGEYMFENFGHEDTSVASGNGFYNLDANTHMKSHLFRVGADYNF
jgi:outer membrane immunogenic protein